jgi:ribosomal protein S18 acetylase RimI-like enzyme
MRSERQESRAALIRPHAVYLLGGPTISVVAGVVVRGYQDGDAAGIVQISRDNGAYYARLAPDYFKEPTVEGFVELVENDDGWRESAENLALVAEVEGEVAGYLEASLQPPLETAEWQTQRDLSQPRLFINFVGTADAFKRMGVATRLVEAAEGWGRSKGAAVAVCDTYIDSPLSIPFWEERMGYTRRAVIFRKQL